MSHPRLKIGVLPGWFHSTTTFQKVIEEEGDQFGRPLPLRLSQYARITSGRVRLVNRVRRASRGRRDLVRRRNRRRCCRSYCVRRCGRGGASGSSRCNRPGGLRGG